MVFSYSQFNVNILKDSGKERYVKTIPTIGRLVFGIAVSLVLVVSAFGQPSAPAPSSQGAADWVIRGAK
jgi:hypothetical protein